MALCDSGHSWTQEVRQGSRTELRDSSPTNPGPPGSCCCCRPGSRHSPAPPVLPPGSKAAKPKGECRSPERISESCCHQDHRDPAMMNGFLLLLTVSLLVMAQIQTGVLGNQNITHTSHPISRAGAGAGAVGGCFLLFLTNALLHLFYFS
nr:CAMPATH-1 antigen [Oryctolagus cuniculus]